jgi:hypothetical protein
VVILADCFIFGRCLKNTIYIVRYVTLRFFFFSLFAFGFDVGSQFFFLNTLLCSGCFYFIIWVLSDIGYLSNVKNNILCMIAAATFLWGDLVGSWMGNKVVILSIFLLFQEHDCIKLHIHMT